METLAADHTVVPPVWRGPAQLLQLAGPLQHLPQVLAAPLRTALGHGVGAEELDGYSDGYRRGCGERIV